MSIGSENDDISFMTLVESVGSVYLLATLPKSPQWCTDFSANAKTNWFRPT